MLDLVNLQESVPKKMKLKVSQDLVDKINKMCEDDNFAEEIKDNFITHINILQDSNWKMDDYVNAIGFVTYQIMGYNDKDSYIKTFPDRYTRMRGQGYDNKKISSFVSRYKNTQLVSALIEQTMIPTWIMNQANYQKAINTQVELMTTASSEKVRCEAANSILTHLKRPEKTEVELSIGVKQDSTLDNLMDSINNLAEQQQTMINQGIKTSDIAEQTIIDVSPE